MTTERDALARDIAERVAERLRASDPALLTTAEAAELLRVPETWVAQEARARRIPHVRLGRYVRFRPDDLAQWERARGEGPRAR